jgi:hypothetical protein
MRTAMRFQIPRGCDKGYRQSLYHGFRVICGRNFICF